MRIGFIAIIVAISLAATASGRDIYVDNAAGDDRYDGLSPLPVARGVGPVRSIARALRIAVAGDRVNLTNTGFPYYESITLQAGKHSGLPSRPFELIGNGAVLDGSAPTPEFAWRPYRGDVVRFRPPRLTHQQIFLNAAPAVRRELGEYPRRVPDLQPLEWCLCGNWVYFRVEPGKLPHQYDLRHAQHSVGITLYEVHDVVVRDLVIQGFQLDGLNAHDGVRRTALVGLTARGNGRSGISIGGASEVVLDACLVGNNALAQVRTEGACTVRILNCDLLDNTAPPLVNEGGRVKVENTLAEQPME